MVQKVFYPICLIILLYLLFFGLGDKVLYAKTGIGRIIPLILLFGCIPFCIYKTLLITALKKKALNLTAISIIVLGISFGLTCEYKANNDFEKYGSITRGNVIKREWSSGKNGGFRITAEFEYNSKKYVTFTAFDYDNKFRIQDEIFIKFSKRNPENNEVLVNYTIDKKFRKM